jgi:hypothetical protein
MLSRNLSASGVLRNTFHVSTGSWSTQLLDINMKGSAFVVGSKGSAAALKRGAVIGPAAKFQTGKVLMAGAFRETQISSTRVFGPFANTTHRFLGLKFKVQGKVHYGWARFSSVIASASNGPMISATLTGYAFETIPNKTIVAGQTKGPDDAGAEELNTTLTPPTPKPATLGLLAMGAPGLSIWRRKESVGAAQ